MALSEHLEKLRYFRRAANFTSVREASKAIGISQTGLSKSITALEEALDTKLFSRTREGLILTKEGQEVIESTDRILKEADALETRLRSLRASPAPAKLQIGLYDSIAVYFFTELRDYLEKIYPHVDIELTADTSSNLSRAVSESRLDIAIGVNLERTLNHKLQFVKLFDDYYGFYVSSYQTRDLEKLPLIIFAQADDLSGVTVEKHLSSQIKQRGVHRVVNFETLKTLTSQGLGIGVLPTQVAKPLVTRGSLVKAEIQKTKQLFGQHTIGFLASKAFLKTHQAFSDDIYRLSENWSRSS